MKIVTAVVNNPTFIEIQYHTFKKYLFCNGNPAEYEFIVFNDAKPFPDVTNDGDITLRSRIVDTCKALGIQCIDVPNDHHVTMDMSSRHADTFNKHLLDYQKQNPDEYLLIDSDMFLIAAFDINAYKKYHCAVVLQQRDHLNYFWPGLFYLNFNNVKNVELLNWNKGYGGDVGGMMRDWFMLQTKNRILPKVDDDLRWAAKGKTFHHGDIYYIRHLWSCSWNETELPDHLKTQTDLLQFLKEDVRNVGGNFYCELYDDVFLHYRAGGNWNEEGMALHNRLSEKLRKCLV